MELLSLQGTPPASPSIKVFEINDCDWVAAASAEEALAFYVDLTGIPAGEALGEGFSGPEEVSAEQMARLKIWDEDTDLEATFAEDLARLVAAKTDFPCMFASSEY